MLKCLPSNSENNQISDDNNVEEETTRQVSFTFVDGGNNAIGGASVHIGTIEKTTGSAGGCTAELTDGTHHIYACLEGENVLYEYDGDIVVDSEHTSFALTMETTQQEI